MTFRELKLPFKIGDIVELTEEMLSCHGKLTGIYSKGHKFRVAGVYVDKYQDWTKGFRLLFPVSKLPANTVPVLYNLVDLEDETRQQISVEPEYLRLQVRNNYVNNLPSRFGFQLKGK